MQSKDNVLKRTCDAGRQCQMMGTAIEVDGKKRNATGCNSCTWFCHNACHFLWKKKVYCIQCYKMVVADEYNITITFEERHKDALTQNLKSAYAHIYGQCSDTLRVKVESRPNYEMLKGNADVIRLLESIKAVMFQFQAQCYAPLAPQFSDSITLISGCLLMSSSNTNDHSPYVPLTMSFLSLCADSGYPPDLLHHQYNNPGTIKTTGYHSHRTNADVLAQIRHS